MKNYLLLLLFLMASANLVFAQKNTINGRVINKMTEKPIKNVKILSTTQTKKNRSDENGKFKIAINKKTKSVTLRKFGFEDLVIDAKEGNFDFKLQKPALYVDSITKIPFSAQQTRLQTLAADRIFLNKQSFSLESALKGQGNYFFAQSAKTGVMPFFLTRGASSIYANNQPLIILDGLPIESEGLGSPISDPISPFLGINLGDIREAYMVKDASHLYGSRGANGVLYLFSEKGKEGKTSFNLSYQIGIISPMTKPKNTLNRTEYLSYLGETYQNRKNIDAGFGLSKDEAFSAIHPNWQTNNDTDWASKMYVNGFSQNLHLSASGGKDKNLFRASVSYQKVKNAIIGNGSEQFGFFLNTSHQVNDKFKIGVTHRTSFTRIDRLAADSSAANPLRMLTNAPFLTENDILTKSIFTNGVLETENGFLRSNVLRNITKLVADYRFSKNLSWKNELGLDLINISEDEFRGSRTALGGQNSGVARNANSFQSNYTFQSFLKYQITQDAHDLSLLGGLSFQNFQNRTTNLQGIGFATDDFNNASGATKIIGGGSLQTNYAYQSAFVSANYALKKKYLFSAAVRYDATSRLGENKRGAIHPNLSAAWVISDEFTDSLGIISFLKLRASYGSSGNTNLYAYSGRGLFSANAYGNTFGIYPKILASPDLAIEKVSQINAGLDFAFLHGYIYGSFDYYIKNTQNLILPLPLSLASGYDYALLNQGSMKNSGIELNLNAKLPIASIIWQTGISFTTNRNEISDLGGKVIRNGIFASGENQAFSSYYLPTFMGVDAKNGDALYKNIDGEKTNDLSKAVYAFAGSALPTSWWTWSNTVSWTNFDFGFCLDAIAGNKVYDASFANALTNQNAETAAQMWRKSGQTTDVPQARYGLENGNAPSTRFLQDGSFVRLRSLSVAYRFDETMLKNFKLSRASVYVRADNIMVLSGYKGGEMQTSAWSNTSLGNATFSAPQMRTISLGINVGF